MTDEHGPTWVGETDVDDVAGLHVEARYTAARLLVTAGGDAVGQVTVPLRAGVADAVTVAEAVRAQLGALPQPRRVPTSVEPVSVVIATRGRPESLGRAVRAVLAGDHPAVTVLVVDNDPTDDATERVVAGLGDPRVRYLREARRGTSAGRNRGLAEADTRLVLFTDDDTEVDTAWARRMAGAFAADPRVVCVSGPVLAARLDTEQERLADATLGWAKGFRPRTFSLAAPPADSAIFPFAPGLLGIGANLAVQADVAREVGGFDEAFGPGSPTRSGEDCEFLVRLVLAGHVLAYEPAAWVRHHHRSDLAGLQEQVEGYAVGLAGFLTKVALSPRGRAAALRRSPAAVRRLGAIADR
ncbi:glycosyltransferase family 2 protein, partial [Pseudonocardia lutea]